jgi:hypothetical protein
MTRPDPSIVRRLLIKILASPGFALADRMSRFLSFAVECWIAGVPLKETTIGVEVYGRAADYDPRIDPIVRVEARRLRAKLREYDANDRAQDRWEIRMPVGGYAIEICERDAQAYTPWHCRPRRYALAAARSQ